MALVQVTTTYKNDITSAETLLLNTARIIDFYAKDASNTIFYYKELGGNRDKSVKYETALSKSAFETLISETLYAERIDLPITYIYSPSKRALATTLNVSAADVIKGIDINTTESYVWFSRGGFSSVKVRVSATIAEIESASSTSESVA